MGCGRTPWIIVGAAGNASALLSYILRIKRVKKQTPCFEYQEAFVLSINSVLKNIKIADFFEY